MKWLLFYQLSLQYAPPSLYSKRQERLPPLPKSREEVHFDGEWAKTLWGKQFLLGLRNDVHFFSTRANLELLGCSDVLYADGTFNICPCMFYQILTIHAFKHGKQIQQLGRSATKKRKVSGSTLEK